MRHLQILLLVVYLMMGGCFDFKSVTQVDEFRVLAVQAEPPEIAPGQGASLAVLWADPEGNGREVEFAWMGCSGFVHASEGIATCDMIVPPVVGRASMGGDTLEIPATPPNLLETDKGEMPSLQVTFIVLMCAGGTLPAPEEYDRLRDTRLLEELCRGGDGLAAFKPVNISRSEKPQTNPTISGFNLNGTDLSPVDEGGLGQVICEEPKKCDVEVELALTMDRASVQTFEVVEFDEIVTVEETLFVSWHVDGGDFENWRTAAQPPPYGAFSNVWLPESPGVFTLYVVAHDTRGGASWQTYQVEVVAP